MPPLPALDHIPAHVVALTDYEPLARERMTEHAWAYVSGGAADEVSVRRNREAFEHIELTTRIFSDLTGAHTRLELFGRQLDYPILLAPVAYQQLVHEAGELATAEAADVMNAGMVLSTLSSVSIEQVTQQTSSPLWFQLYIQPDRGFTRALVDRVQAAGAQAIVVTVDATVGGMRNREQRSCFQLPVGVEAVHLKGAIQPPVEPRTLTDVPLFGTVAVNTAPTWRDLEWLLANSRAPVLVKGVTSPTDAERLVQMGVAGIVVSNHGGRTLDTMVPPIDVLPNIAKQVQGRVPILMDGGVRRGTDVLKAIALGATAVLIGRPYIYALATAGALGVAHVLAILRAELEAAMVLTGCANLSEINSEILWKRV